MVDEKKGCQKSDQFEDKPEKCSSEQIVKCHGDAKIIHV